MSELERRKYYTDNKINELVRNLSDSNSLISDVACVYATGSFGRHEADVGSDLDVFIVSKSKARGESGKGARDAESQLRRLNEICLKADLIQATRKVGLPDFDGDGRYLVHHTVEDLKSKLGHPEDDALNTFTARLLLLLESSPLLNKSVYDEIVGDVVAAYCEDYPGHEDDFVPAFLTNDILRMWRTFCVNYEARTERDPIEKKIKRRQKNYTLKHSRLLTCYSAVIYLLAVYKMKGAVSPPDIVKMTALSPSGRLKWLLSLDDVRGAHEPISAVLDQYQEFLKVKADTEKFENMFVTSDDAKKHMSGAYAFSSSIFDAVDAVGEKSKLHRMILV